MAKIIKRGSMPPTIKYDLECRYCNTIARFCKEELKFYEDIDEYRFVAYDCPCCKKRNRIPEKQLPKPIEKEEEEKYCFLKQILKLWRK